MRLLRFTNNNVGCMGVDAMWFFRRRYHCMDVSDRMARLIWDRSAGAIDDRIRAVADQIYDAKAQDADVDFPIRGS